MKSNCFRLEVKTAINQKTAKDKTDDPYISSVPSTRSSHWPDSVQTRVILAVFKLVLCTSLVPYNDVNSLPFAVSTVPAKDHWVFSVLYFFYT